MDKFEEKDFKKERKIVKNDWFDWCNWLTNYMPKPIRETADKLISLFKSNTSKNYGKTVSGSRKKIKEAKNENQKMK